MQTEKVQQNLKAYVWFQRFKEPLLWGPVMMTYVIHFGQMTLEDYCLMEAIVMFGGALLEFPTGVLADLVGRKKTIQLGSIFLFSVALGMGFVSSPLGVWITDVVWIVGYSLCSGADRALLYDSLKALGFKGAEIKSMSMKVEGSAIGSRCFLFAICGLFAGPLFEIDPHWPFFLSIPGAAVSLGATFFFFEPERPLQTNWRQKLSVLTDSVREVAQSPQLIWIVVFMSLIVVSSKMWFLTYNPYFEQVSIRPLFFGFIFAGINFCSWAASRWALRIESRLGEGWSLALMVGLIAVPVGIMGMFFTVSSIFLLIFPALVRGFQEPFIMYFLNHRVSSQRRASINSIRSSATGLVHFVGFWGFGKVLQQNSLAHSLEILGVIVLGLGIILHLWYRKIFKN